MGIRLDRCLRGPECLIAGEFTIETDDARPVLSCPLCGHRFALPSQCRIEPDGRVVPRVACPVEVCPFAEFVELGSVWDEVAR